MKKLFFALSLALVVGVGAGWGDAEVSAVSPSDVGLVSGDLISATFSSDPDVYIVNEWGYKRLFLNPDIFQFYSHLGGFAQVKIVTPQVRDSFITSGYLRECETGDQRVWGVESVGEDRAILHWINTSGEQAVLDDPDFFKKVFCINQREFSWYQIGSTYNSVREVPPYVRGGIPTPIYPSYTPVYPTPTYGPTPTLQPQSIPIVTLPEYPSSQYLYSGTVSLLDFTMSTVGGDFGWKQIRFDIEKTPDIALSNLRLFENGVDITTSVLLPANCLEAGCGAGSVTVTYGGNRLVLESVDNPRVYSLKATVRGDVVGSYVRTSILRHERINPPVPSTFNIVAQGIATFIWTDAQALGVTSSRWFDDRNAQGLPISKTLVRTPSVSPSPTYSPSPSPSPQFNLRIAVGGAGQLSCVGNQITVHSSPYIAWDDLGQGGLVDILRYNPVTGAYELIYQLGGQNYYPLDVNLPLTAPLKYRVRLAAQPWVMSNILDIPVYCSSPSPSATPVIRPIMSVENRTNSSRNPAFADGDSIRITVTDGAYRSNTQVYACHSHTGVSPSSGCTWGYTNAQGVWVFEYTLTTGAGNRSLWADASGISSAQVHITINAPATPTPTLTPMPTPTREPIAICDYAAPPAGCSYVPGPNYNRETSCGMVLACESRVVTSAASPIGAHDEATCEMTHGWICDADNFSASLDVHFYADGGPGAGVFLGAVSAGGGREYQVGDLCGGNSNHGYRFAIPTWLKDGKAHSIFAYAININSDGKQSGINPAIGGTPMVITCSTSASASSSRQTATLSRALGTGMAGDDVRTLQQELVRRGMLAADAITGYFGRLTASAVKNFQWKNNIISTGVVGPVTRDALQGQ